MVGVYLLHFSPSYKHAGHYLGYADNIERRLAEHRNGTGARLTQVAVQAGCQLHLARVWADGDRTLERKLKNRHEGPALCPLCRLEFTLDDVEEMEF